MKYIRLKLAGFVLFEESQSHKDVAGFLMFNPREEVLSAGFVYATDLIDDGKPVCRGRSESLNIGSRPEDTSIVRKRLDLPTF